MPIRELECMYLSEFDNSFRGGGKIMSIYWSLRCDCEVMVEFPVLIRLRK